MEKAKADSPEAALADPKKRKIYNRYMNEVAMAGSRDNSGEYVTGIEDHLPNAQYQRDDHRNAKWSKTSPTTG